jgi:hypothetical protein
MMAEGVEDRRGESRWREKGEALRKYTRFQMVSVVRILSVCYRCAAALIQWDVNVLFTESNPLKRTVVHHMDLASQRYQRHD